MGKGYKNIPVITLKHNFYEVNQRGVASVNTNGAYPADQWKLSSTTGSKGIISLNPTMRATPTLIYSDVNVVSTQVGTTLYPSTALSIGGDPHYVTINSILSGMTVGSSGLAYLNGGYLYLSAEL